VRKHRIPTVNKLSTSLLIVKAQECLIYVYTSDVITFKAIELFSNKKIKERGDVSPIHFNDLYYSKQVTAYKKNLLQLMKKRRFFFLVRLETRAAGSLESHIT